MTMTISATSTPRTSALDRELAMQLAATEYDRVTALLRSLTPEDWGKPTACPGWDVRAVACHLLGMAEMAASMRDQLRQSRAARARAARTGEAQLDALTGLQVDERTDMSPAEIVERLAARGPKAARARKRTPAFIRHRRMPMTQDVGGQQEAWTFGYLIDVILTRDSWMHRVDISRATGAHLELTPEHDGVLVADVVAEWAARHGQPFTLRLAGPAGGEWSVGSGGPEIEMDAVDFCAILSGRGAPESVLGTVVPF